MYNNDELKRLEAENEELKGQISVYKRLIDMMSETIKHSATIVEFVSHNFVIDLNKVSD